MMIAGDFHSAQLTSYRGAGPGEIAHLWTRVLKYLVDKEFLQPSNACGFIQITDPKYILFTCSSA